MDPADGSTPEVPDIEAEAAALGITVAQLEARRVHEEQNRRDRENAPPDTLWGWINPRGIITIPRSLPLGVRQLASLGLALCYPFWLAFSLTVWLGGRIVIGVGWVLFLPVRAHYKHKDPVAYAADKERLKGRKLSMSLELEPEDPPARPSSPEA